MQTPQRFSISPSQTGDVYATKFEFKHNLPASFVNVLWSFGDGTFATNQKSASVVYQYPGVYTVGLSAWSSNTGTLIEDQGTVSVDYVHRDGIFFAQTPDGDGYVNVVPETPFVLRVISSRINEPIVLNFHAIGSKSVPYTLAAREQWGFLIPTWKFLDKDKNLIDGSLTVTTTPVYKDSTVVAVSAEVPFYYVDGAATTITECPEPIILYVSLDTSKFNYPLESQVYPHYSYSNNKAVIAATTWNVNIKLIDGLKVTENYLDEIYPYKWKGVPIPVMITPISDDIDAFDYPRSNAIGLSSAVNVVLSSSSFTVASSDYQVSNTPLYFKATDEYNNKTSGYIFTTITPLCSYPHTVFVSASTVIHNFEVTDTTKFTFPLGLPIATALYVSNPSEGVLNRIQYSFQTGCPNKNLELFSSELQSSLSRGTNVAISVPTLTGTTFNYEVTGVAAINGIAVNPLNGRVYVVDADQNTAAVYSNKNVLLSSVSLSSNLGFTNLSGNAPTYISMDGNENVWIAGFDNFRVVKLNSSLQFLASAAPPGIQANVLDSTGGAFLTNPSVVETDQANNIWVSYANPLSSNLIKYSSQGAYLSSAAISVSAVPVSLSVNLNNNIWVANWNSNTVELYSGTNASRLSSLTSFLRPSYTALDRNNNLWVTHGYNFCSYVDTQTGQISSWKFFATALGDYKNITFESVSDILSASLNYTSQEIQEAYYENEIWGGLTVDVYDRIWLIDSQHNAVINFNPVSPADSSLFVVYPTPNTNHVLSGQSTVTVPVSNVRSAQALGDWTGNRWYQKYITSYASQSVFGTSEEFTINDLNEGYQIAKVNEEFDGAAYFKSLALTEHFQSNTELFDVFLKAVVGDGNPTQESIARVAYERIANFIQTHGDFETAEMDQLQAFAKQLSIDTKTFGTGFPTAINRLLNLFSIPKHRLRGLVDYDQDVQSNIGALLAPSDLVTAGETILARTKRYEDFRIVNVAPFDDNTSVYPLSDISISGFVTPLSANYYFFRYEPTVVGYKQNIINWNSNYTTVPYTLSSYSDWYGENGLVELMFNQLLTKELFGTPQ